MDASPIIHELHLRCDVEHAFETYAERFEEWWPPSHTAGAETLESVVLEPVEGGRIYEQHDDGWVNEWGRVTVWEPGEEIGHTFTLAHGDRPASAVRILFSPDGDGCVVRFEHGGWTKRNVELRRKFGDWGSVLAAYAELAQSRQDD